MNIFRKINLLLATIIILILFNNLLIANENKEECFPFKEDWGITTKEFRKNYKYKPIVPDKSNLGGEAYYENILNLYDSEFTVTYLFKREKPSFFKKYQLYQVFYSTYFIRQNIQQPLKKELIIFNKLKQNLKCLLGEPIEDKTVTKDGFDGYFIIWENDKTVVFLNYIEMFPNITIEFYDSNNLENKEQIRDWKERIKKIDNKNNM